MCCVRGLGPCCPSVGLGGTGLHLTLVAALAGVAPRSWADWGRGSWHAPWMQGKMLWAELTPFIHLAWIRTQLGARVPRWGPWLVGKGTHADAQHW